MKRPGKTISAQRQPIFLVGAGGIVNTAHLPAYAIAGYDVQGIYDKEYAKSKNTAGRFSIPHVFTTMEEMLAATNEHTIFDIAVPGTDVINVLEKIPAGSAVLMQKPMGETLDAAKKIREITRSKKLVAGVNFQLRYAPYITEVRRMLTDGVLGEIYDIEVNVTVYTPWRMWEFLYDSPRVEILYHSIHYIDLIRSFLGEPTGIYAKTTRHPGMKELASVRSNIVMDYGDMVRANILTNHCHIYGTTQQQSYIKLECSKGAVKIGMGILKNYPHGEDDTFEYVLTEKGDRWQFKKIEGSWFPHGFIGSMEQVMLTAAGVIDAPDNSVEDCIHTMACVEAAYASSKAGGTRLEKL